MSLSCPGNLFTCATHYKLSKVQEMHMLCWSRSCLEVMLC